jgi:hypothetical protein
MSPCSCFRRYTQDNNTFYYPHEKYFSGEPTPELPGWDNNSNPGDGDQVSMLESFFFFVTVDESK